MSDKNVYDLASEDTNLHKKARGEYAGPCPKCGGTDRFVVRIEKNFDTATDAYKGGFMCRSCWDPNNPPIRPERPRWGDFIDYYQHFKGMNFFQAQKTAIEYVSGMVEDALARVDRAASMQQQVSENAPPSQVWQDKNREYVNAAQACLWTPAAETVLAYLHERGLRDETIKALSYGAIHSSDVNRLYLGRVEVDTWFVVIPWFIEGALWQVQMRDIAPDCPKEERYRKFPGSGKGLYLADCLKKKRPTFIVEGEFNAAILAQESGDVVNVVATGFKDGAKASKWAMRLSQIPVCFIALDNDAAGEDAAQFWLRVLKHKSPIRFRPLKKDINAMYIARPTSVAAWVNAALLYWQEESEDQQEQQEEPLSQASLIVDDSAIVEDQSEQQEEPLLCSVDGCTINALEDDSFYFDESGSPYCGKHGPQAAAYAESDQQLKRDIQLVTNNKLEQFAHAISAIASVFGPDCKIDRLERGTTMRAALEQQYPKARIYGIDEYTPVTLPALPRSKCPHAVLALRKDGSNEVVKQVPCSGVPGPAGWCKSHEQVHMLLALGAKLGYPQFQVSESLAIGSGVACWEDYAIRAMAQVQYTKSWRTVLSNNRLNTILPRLKAMLDQREQEARQQQEEPVVFL